MDRIASLATSTAVSLAKSSPCSLPLSHPRRVPVAVRRSTSAAAPPVRSSPCPRVRAIVWNSLIGGRTARVPWRSRGPRRGLSVRVRQPVQRCDTTVVRIDRAAASPLPSSVSWYRSGTRTPSNWSGVVSLARSPSLSSFSPTVSPSVVFRHQELRYRSGSSGSAFAKTMTTPDRLPSGSTASRR